MSGHDESGVLPLPSRRPASMLAGYQRVSSTDINILHDAVEPLAVGHDLQALDPGRPLDGIVNGLSLGAVSLVWVRYGGAGVIVDTPPTAGAFALCVPSAPMGAEYRRRGSRQTAAGNLVLSHDEPMRMTPDPVQGCLVVATSTGRLTDHLQAYLGTPPTTPLRFPSDGYCEEPGILPGQVVEQAWRHACSVLTTAAGSGIHPMAARSLEQSLLSAILLGLPHSATAQLADSGELESVPAGTAERIREWLEANHDRPVGVADLAAAMGLSIRRVQAVCRNRWDQTPMQLLRGIRLDHARAALLTADPDGGAIARAAAAAGFSRVTRFAAAYRARFGEPPTRTLSAPRSLTCT